MLDELNINMSMLDETNQTESAPSGIGQTPLVNLELATAGGPLVVRLAYSSVQLSGLLRNLILDTGLDCSTETIPVIGGGINKMMPDELDKFITCWRDYYAEIPANLDVVSIHAQVDIPANISGLFKPGLDNGYQDYLAWHKLLDVVGDSWLVNWDIRQLARFIKVANFLDLPRMLELFKFVLAKCMLECKPMYRRHWVLSPG